MRSPTATCFPSFPIEALQGPSALPWDPSRTAPQCHAQLTASPCCVLWESAPFSALLYDGNLLSLSRRLFHSVFQLRLGCGSKSSSILPKVKKEKDPELSFSYLRIFNWTVNPTLLCFRRLFPNRTVSSLMRAEIYYPISELYISLSVCCSSSSLVTQTDLFPHYFTAEFPPAPPHSTVLPAPPQDAPWPSYAPFPLSFFEMPITRHCSAILLLQLWPWAFCTAPHGKDI